MKAFCKEPQQLTGEINLVGQSQCCLPRSSEGPPTSGEWGDSRVSRRPEGGPQIGDSIGDLNLRLQFGGVVFIFSSVNILIS